MLIYWVVWKNSYLQWHAALDRGTGKVQFSSCQGTFYLFCAAELHGWATNTIFYVQQKNKDTTVVSALLVTQWMQQKQQIKTQLHFAWTLGRNWRMAGTHVPWSSSGGWWCRKAFSLTHKWVPYDPIYCHPAIDDTTLPLSPVSKGDGLGQLRTVGKGMKALREFLELWRMQCLILKGR